MSGVRAKARPVTQGAAGSRASLTAKKRKKKAKKKSRLRVNSPVALAVVAVVLAALWLLYPAYQIRVEQDKQLSEVRREYAQLRSENVRLRKRIEQIKSPEYIERYAREKLGLVKPGENAYVVLPPSRAATPTATPERSNSPTRSAETTGTWERVKTFFAGLFGR